ncbi:hypothetical protein [Thermocoleostomius sinensis]|jgi:uncharacterized membrane protein YebE (DUF533 family)|uniref:Uncharacterized protein n=1 Tax=Thermocoleostomius sinensis A174 TaxID=2016057 RepID=A0A9E9C6W8_9CYAN|nr:hypothetical protein [Thermocoleostomius sinensis]WAL59719.1 hypothetical protein OXH18_21485 [Thermocoleostomius sinensis A174]
MEIERSDTRPLTLEEQQKFQQLKAIVEKAISDGIITHDELQSIDEKIFSVARDEELTFQELDLVEQLVWSKVREGTLVIDYSFNTK